MKFSIDKHDKYVTFKLEENKLNSIIAPMLKSELILLNNESFRNVILDLSDVKYTDSSGLSSLLVGNRLSKNSNGTFVIANAQASVIKLIEISQLQTVLNCVPTINEAVDLIFIEEIERDLRKEQNS